MVDRIVIEGGEEILIDHGLPSPLLPERPRERVLVLTQPGARRVAARVAEGIDEGHAVAVVELPDREAAKELAVVGDVYRSMRELGMGRHDTVVGVGGGTVTDVAGFVGATWMRGIEVVYVPTTLLAAVDAAIGGKTGVNLDGKNLVGAFWHPRRVIIDLDVIGALPEELVREGSAEAVKAGFIGDPHLVELYRREGLDADLAEVVRRAVAVKARVVGADFRETGGREVLNYGHTVGHGLEATTGISHGLAVGLGMVAAGAVSARRHGFDAADQRRVLAGLALPTTTGEAGVAVGADEVLDYVAQDKKRDAEGIRFVNLRAIGDPVVEHVTPGELRDALTVIGVR